MIFVPQECCGEERLTLRRHRVETTKGLHSEEIRLVELIDANRKRAASGSPELVMLLLAVAPENAGSGEESHRRGND